MSQNTSQNLTLKKTSLQKKIIKKYVSVCLSVCLFRLSVCCLLLACCPPYIYLQPPCPPPTICLNVHRRRRLQAAGVSRIKRKTSLTLSLLRNETRSMCDLYTILLSFVGTCLLVFAYLYNLWFSRFLHVYMFCVILWISIRPNATERKIFIPFVN